MACLDPVNHDVFTKMIEATMHAVQRIPRPGQVKCSDCGE